MPPRSVNRRVRRRRTIRRRRVRTRRSVRRPRSIYAPSARFFKRKARITAVGTSTTGYASGAITFSLDSLPAYTEYTTLFDQFSVRYVKIYIVHRATNISMIETTNNVAVGMPNLVIVRDYDDSTAPSADEAGYNTLRQYDRSKTFSFTPDRRDFSIGIRPAVAQDINSGVTTSYAPRWKAWVDCDYPATPHYGLKYVIQVPYSGVGTCPSAYFDIYATYYLSFKQAR